MAPELSETLEAGMGNICLDPVWDHSALPTRTGEEPQSELMMSSVITLNSVYY